MYDETGQCIEQPFEETVHPDGRFKEKVKVAGYPVQELGGLLFAYMGPQPAPLLPRWEQLLYDDAVRDIAISQLPCNWLQCQENSLDAVHSEWLHFYFGNYVRTGNAVPDQDQPTTKQIAFDEFKYGIIKRRLQEGFPEDGEDWAKGHPVLFPNILWVGSRAQTTTQWRVPVDDENTLHISYYVYRAAPGTQVPKQEIAAYRNVPLYEPDGRLFVDITFNQDYMAWITQGRIANRSKEILGQSDVGIILFRKQLRQQLRVVADGGDPMNVFRTLEEATPTGIPMEDVKHRRASRGRYSPGENGVSPIIPMIEETVLTWADYVTTPA
jgi:5,5'-dehydrodivanillate O-demethylase